MSWPPRLSSDRPYAMCILAYKQTDKHTHHRQIVNKYKQKANFLLVTLSLTKTPPPIFFSELPIHSQCQPQKDVRVLTLLVWPPPISKWSTIQTFPLKTNRLSTIMFYILPYLGFPIGANTPPILVFPDPQPLWLCTPFPLKLFSIPYFHSN